MAYGESNGYVTMTSRDPEKSIERSISKTAGDTDLVALELWSTYRIWHLIDEMVT